MAATPVFTSGFTLTELSIVLIIVALLIGGMLMPLSAQQDIRNTTETTRQLEEIREALMGFAVVNGHLPCPAISTSDGREDRNSETHTAPLACAKRYGWVPWVTLGVKPSDSWGHLFMYSVTPKFSNAKSKFTLNDASKTDITIKTRDASGELVNLTNDKDIPAVVLSTGKNGYLSWTLRKVTQNPDSPNANDDEDTNSEIATAGTTFVSLTPQPATAPGGEFDDLVTWISPNILFSRMIAAGRLP